MKKTLENGVSSISQSAEEELKKKNLILEQLDTFVLEYNFNTKELYIDPVKEKFISVQWNKEDIMNKRLDDIVFRPDIPTVSNFLNFVAVTPENSRRSITVRLFTQFRIYEWFRISQICFFDSEGNKERVAISFTNTDERTEIEQSLKFHYEKDPLTCLPNLNSFSQKVTDLIQSNPDSRYEMIRMDVDCFRIINEMLGTEEGDNLLKFIGVRIQECLDEEDEVAYCRASSDVFVMCVPVRLYSVRGIIEFLKKAVLVYPCKIEVKLSFGVYYITRDDVERMIPVNIFIDRAATAQSVIKGNYLHHVAYYNDGMQRQEKNEHMITADMHDALTEEQFKVFLQPKVDMTTGKVVGAEALSRWKHPKYGMIMPGQYIPIFERNGFVIEIDEYIIRSTCRIIRKWIDMGIPTFPVSVNLSRTNLYNPNILKHIEQYVNEFAIPRELIEFELTESGFAADNNHLSKLSRKLQRDGYTVYMDDFGSGYSSLNALKDISVNILKIDLRFLPAEKNDQKANIILKHIVNMVKELDMDIVVEGVETEEQIEFLLSIGCRMGQGFYYYKPMPLEEYEKVVMEEKE